MSLLEIISSADMQPVLVDVTRTIEGTYVEGVYQPAAPVTLSNVQMLVMPAYNLNRVVGGDDLHALVDNQRVTEVVQCITATWLKTRTLTTDPDIVTGLGGASSTNASWTVGRVEVWPDLDGDLFYHCVLFRITQGSS